MGLLLGVWRSYVRARRTDVRRIGCAACVGNGAGAVGMESLSRNFYIGAAQLFCHLAVPLSQVRAAPGAETDTCFSHKTHRHRQVELRFLPTIESSCLQNDLNRCIRSSID